MTKLSVIIAAVAFGAATSAASAGGFGWDCRGCGYSNGTEFTGVALNGNALTKASPPVVKTVILRSGEML
jgi:hypothetical protein